MIRPKVEVQIVLLNIKVAIINLLDSKLMTLKEIASSLSFDPLIISYTIKKFKKDFVKIGETYTVATKNEFIISVSSNPKTYIIYHKRVSPDPIFSVSIDTKNLTLEEVDLLCEMCCERFRNAQIPPITREEFYAFHTRCPLCKHNDYCKIIRKGIIEIYGNDFYDRVNKLKCENCAWEGTYTERFPNVPLSFWYLTK